MIIHQPIWYILGLPGVIICIYCTQISIVVSSIKEGNYINRSVQSISLNKKKKKSRNNSLTFLIQYILHNTATTGNYACPVEDHT